MTFTVHVSGQALLPRQERAWILRKIRQLKLSKELSVSFEKDEAIKALNRQWRGLNKVTDVLSFSAQEGEPMPGLEQVLGDIVISVDRAQVQARECGHDFREEILVLFVHGLTHLMGHDHELGAEHLEKQIQAEMSLLQEIDLDPKIALCGRV